MKFVQLSSGPHWADTVPRRDGPACLKRVGDAHRHVSASSIGCVAGFRACQCVIADRSSVHSVGACVRQMLTCASTCAAHPRSGGARPLSAVPRDSVRPQSGRQRSIRCVLTRLPEAQHATLTRGCFLQCCCRADAALQRHGRAAGCYARGCACPSSPGHAGGAPKLGARTKDVGRPPRPASALGTVAAAGRFSRTPIAPGRTFRAVTHPCACVCPCFLLPRTCRCSGRLFILGFHARCFCYASAIRALARAG